MLRQGSTQQLNCQPGMRNPTRPRVQHSASVAAIDTQSRSLSRQVSQSDLHCTGPTLARSKTAHCLGQFSPRSFFKGDSELAQSMTSLQTLREVFVHNFFGDDVEHNHDIDDTCFSEPHNSSDVDQRIKLGASREDDCGMEPMTPSESTSTAPGSTILASPLSSTEDTNYDSSSEFSTINTLALAFTRRVGEDVHTADFNIHDEIHRKWEAEQCRKTQFTRDFGQRIRDRQLAAKSGIQKQSPRGGTDAEATRLKQNRMQKPPVPSMASHLSPRTQAGTLGSRVAATGRSSTQATLQARQNQSQRQASGSMKANSQASAGKARIVPRQSEAASTRIAARKGASQTESRSHAATTVTGSTRPGASRAVHTAPPQNWNLKHQAQMADSRKIVSPTSLAASAPSIAMNTPTAAELAIASLVDDLQDWAMS